MPELESLGSTRGRCAPPDPVRPEVRGGSTAVPRARVSAFDGLHDARDAARGERPKRWKGEPVKKLFR